MTQTTHAKSDLRRVILSGMLGNGLEWYDYALYAQMSFILSELFFPPGDVATRLLATFGIFAVGFVFRPLGALLFGWIGDQYGRRASLVIAILMMAVPTGCIGLLPTYAQAGMWAPALLTLIRVFQGLSLGGEFSGSITYIVEHAPPHRRGLAGSASLVSMNLGFLLGSVVALGFVHLLSPEDFRSWGWRVPFLLGVVIGLVGLYIRSSCSESPLYEEAKAKGELAKAPLRALFRDHWKPMLLAFAFYLSVTMPYYLCSVYLLSYTQAKLGLSAADALLINALAMGAMGVMFVPAALLSDRVGRKVVMRLGAIAMLIAALPIFWLMHQSAAGQGFYPILAAQMLFLGIVGFYAGCVPTTLVELFPTAVRSSGMALSYNAAAALFGGTAPMVCEWLLHHTGTPYSIPGYVVLCNVITLVALAFFHDRWRSPL